MLFDALSAPADATALPDDGGQGFGSNSLAGSQSVQPFLFGDGWVEVLDGNDSARAIFHRHYSYRPRPRGRRRHELIIGPGEKFLLLTADAGALCAWRREQHRRDGQVGVECCIFRREIGDGASDLLREAMRLAWCRWPGQRLFTFIDPFKVEPTWRARRPTWGHVFYLAGWKFAGVTKKRLHILEAIPELEAHNEPT